MKDGTEGSSAGNKGTQAPGGVEGAADGRRRREHPLFRRFPIDGRTWVDGLAEPTPYHVYDGTLMMLGGSADASAACAQLTAKGLWPVLDMRGRALMAVWVGDFSDASLGPHHELQLSLFASTRPLPPVASHPFAIHRALLTLPGLRMVCAALWNNPARVASYNALHLGLDARPADSHVLRCGSALAFRFREADGRLLAEGEVLSAARPAPAAAWQLLRHIGWQGSLRLLRSPALNVAVAPLAGHRLCAQTWTHSDHQAVAHFGPQDRIRIGHTPLGPALHFEPTCVQRFEGLRFVYLRPEADGDADERQALVG